MIEMVKVVGETYAKLGYESFLNEEYAEASKNFAQALEADPSNAEWQRMSDLSRRNTIARADLVIPSRVFFERVGLLSGPAPGALPTHAKEVEPQSFLRSIGRALGDGCGVVGTAIMTVLTAAVGKL